MQVKIISFTGQGLALSKKIAQMKTKQFNIYAYPKFIAAKEESRIYPVSSLDAWTKEHFDHSNALIFIGAAGIALRAVAPYIRDKFSDPAVLCIDEKRTVCHSALIRTCGRGQRTCPGSSCILEGLPRHYDGKRCQS